MSNDIDLNALRLFDQVARADSLTAASRRAQRSVSAVSRQIAALERALGQRLFYRHSRALRLTDAGQRYHAAIAPLLAQVEQATESVFSPESEPAGVLRINGPVAFCQRQLMPILDRFQQRYPRIRAELSLTDAFVDPVRSGSDVTFRVGPLVDSSLAARRLAPMNYVLAAAPAYFATHGTPETPRALLGHRCLRYQGAHGRQFWYYRRHARADFEKLTVDGPLYSDDAQSLVQAALLGQGLVLFPSWLLDHELRSGALRAALTVWDWAVSPRARDIFLLHAGRPGLAPKVRVFVDHVIESVGEPPIWDRWRAPPDAPDRAC